MKSKCRKQSPTWCDVGEAKRKGVDDALTFCVTVLTDNMGFTQDQVVEFMKGIAYLSDSVSKGYVNTQDLKRVQLKEYMIDLL